MKLTKRQRNNNLILTLVQYSALILFLILTPKIAKGFLLQLVELAGVVLGVWAIVVMNKSKINIMPEPRKGAELITDGPYAFIRHPMYAAIILTLTPLIVSYFDWVRFAVLIVLYVNLFFKLRFEESLLKDYFEGYKEYMKRTKRLLPFVW